MAEQISHYRIINKLGAGGMGEVFLAEDSRLDRRVAIKLLPAEFTGNADRVRRFMQEAKAASALNHPNIITVYDIGESEAGRFIVMELVAGRTLRELVAEDNSLDGVLALGQQIAKALSAAHAAGITHRDIKPDNIMVRDDGYVKVLDFGLARLRPATESDDAAATLALQTTPGTVMGTVAYMSPEQARGEVVSHLSDIFALGIVLYELATGQHPFKAGTPVGSLHAITSQTPAPPQQWKPTLPDALNDLLLRMLEKDAGLRPTASRVAQTLQEIEHGRGRENNGRGEGETLLLPPTPTPFVAGQSALIRHLVGRKTERAELQTAFNAAKNGRGLLVCVSGEPGIGKTALVEDFLSELVANEHCMIARGRCSERLAGTEAYLPLLEALENLLRGNARTVTAQRLKQIAPTWYAQVTPLLCDSEDAARLLAEVKTASQERIKRELANFLQEAARQCPLVLFFDDLHWADVSTIDVLSFLAGKFDVLNVLIVVTYRPSDMLLAKHPFLQIKPDLQARGVCHELQLRFLNETEVVEYLELKFPQHGFPPEFPQLIYEKTEGSPLFMADLVKYLRDREVIRSASQLPTQAPQTGLVIAWTLAQALPDIESDLPESVRGMIERKIAQLGEEDRKLLTVACVQGYEFDSAVLAKVLGIEADEIEERLEKLDKVFSFVRLGGETEFPNGTLTLKYRFVHVLYQNALYFDLRSTRKATLSRDVAQALEEFYDARAVNVANDLAQLWEVARDYVRAVGYFFQAARSAAQINAHCEVVELARRGLEALLKLPESPERDRQELGLQLTLGLSLQNVVSWAAPETGEAFNRARQLCLLIGGDARLFIALVGITNFHLVRAEFQQAQELCEQMLPLAEQSGNPVLQVAAHVLASAPPNYRGDIVQACQHSESALALDRREYHQAYLSMANEDWGISMRRLHCHCLWSLGYADQALALAQEAVAIAEQLAHPFSLGGSHFAVGAIFLLHRDWPASQKQFEKLFAIAKEYSLGSYLLRARIFHAMVRVFQKPDPTTIEEMKQGIEYLRSKGETLGLTGNLVRLAEALRLANRCSEGLNVIAEAMSIAERFEERFWQAELWRLKGDLLVNHDDNNTQVEAEACYHEAIEVARRQSAKAWELRAAMSLARLWLQQGKVAEARQMLAEIYGWFTEGFETADLKDAKALLNELGFG